MLGELARDTGLSACLLQKVAFTQHLLYRVLHFLNRAMVMELSPFYKLKKKKAQKNVTHMKKKISESDQQGTDMHLRSGLTLSTAWWHH